MIGPDAALLEWHKLAAAESLLRFDRSPTSERERKQADKVSQQSNDEVTDSDHARNHAK